MKKYPSAKPHITAKEKKYVIEVLNSGILSIGQKQEQFEKKFSEFVGTKYAIAVSSGTAGLHLAMIAAGIGPGDEVITTPFSFVASANAILYVGAKPVFADIDPLTYNIDPNKIEQAITKKTKAILVVHIFGQPAEMAPILKIAKKHNLKIIEDACESLGAKYKGRMAGTFGESAVFAFYANKQMTTGEGGVIVTGDKRIYELCRSLRNQGRAENMQWLDHNRLGYNYRMDEMSAAVGLAQIENIDFLLSERRIADWYHEFLAPHGGLIQAPQTHPHNTHTWMVYVVRIKNLPDGKAGKNINRDRVILDLQKQGISTKPYLPSIHLFSFYRSRFGFKPGDYPISEAVSASALALPFYIGLKKQDIKYISNKVADAVKKYN
ncbi:MAG: DegT/DnrJ/EryC1/StrS family aminotransferase [Candidatus Giovannonibacteria bacterium]|nr:MAG: DegT/DnrJ/EryC1/StrS family aminotransferase [Candidatus Giovannonibacteria bacterium]